MEELLILFFNTILNETTKKCIGANSCGQTKSLAEFEWRNDSNSWRNICKECRLAHTRQYWQENKEEKAIKAKIYREDNKAIIKIKKKKYYKANKEKILDKEQARRDAIGYTDEIKQYNKQYREENKNKLNIKKQEYRNKPEIKETMKEYNKIYRSIPINKIKRNKRHKERMDAEPHYKLRHIMGSTIYNGLKHNNSNKNNLSILKFLPYTIEQLKIHIENLFSHSNNLIKDNKMWMTWNNWGIYNSQTWDDNDPSTWTWQIDHIIPHSTFKYETMDCQEFRDCWALSNLRPLSAKQNQLDGSTKIRHKKI